MRDTQAFRRRRQRRRDHLGPVHSSRPARRLHPVQTGQPLLRVPVAPQIHRRPGHPDQLRDLHIRRAIRGEQTGYAYTEELTWDAMKRAAFNRAFYDAKSASWSTGS